MRDFFFQAEDGIRDSPVTRVQTCALPICSTPVQDISIWILSAARKKVSGVVEKVH